jgi:UDP-N-acetylglucosamine acyltransferase
MDQNIHSTAIVDQRALLGANVEVGAYSIVGPNVTLGDQVKLHSHVVIDGHTKIGSGCEIFPFAMLGGAPQHTRFNGEPSELHIGQNCLIREHVTMHPGTAIDAMKTIVGDNGLFFVGAHVAHDCVVGNNVIFANNAALGGHVKIGDHVMLGGFAAVQQWCRIGAHSMIGAHSLVDADVIPFAIATGNRATLSGINVIGLERRGFSPEIINGLRDLFRNLIRGGGLFSARLAAAETQYMGTVEYEAVFEFINTAGRNGVCQSYKRS